VASLSPMFFEKQSFSEVPDDSTAKKFKRKGNFVGK
jgi:hypothetical protein